MAERPIRAKVNPRAQMPRDDEPRANAPTRETRRYLLPTLRVAEFVQPNVGEFMKLRDHAVMRCRTENGNETPSEYELGTMVAELSLRRLLCGLSQKPVPVIHRAGAWDEDRARESATAAVLEAADQVRKRHEWAIAAGAASPGAPWSDEEIEDRIEHAVQQASYDAEDEEAMKAAANVSRVVDIDWDSSSGAVARLRDAQLGTDQATEWIALQQIAADFFRRLITAAQNAPRFGKKDLARSTTRSWK